MSLLSRGLLFLSFYLAANNLKPIQASSGEKEVNPESDIYMVELNEAYGPTMSMFFT